MALKESALTAFLKNVFFKRCCQMRALCSLLTVSSMLSTLHNSAQRDSESNVSSRGSVSFKRTDKDIERGMKSSIQFKVGEITVSKSLVLHFSGPNSWTVCPSVLNSLCMKSADFQHTGWAFKSGRFRPGRCLCALVEPQPPLTMTRWRAAAKTTEFLSGDSVLFPGKVPEGCLLSCILKELYSQNKAA